MYHESKHQYLLGVDIGGTKVNIGIVDIHGRVVAKRKIPTECEKGYRQIIQNIAENIHMLLKENGFSKLQIKSAGFGIPGTTDPQTGMVGFAPNLDWRNVPFRELMNKELNMDVFMAQDTQAAAFAECLFGAGHGSRSIVCVTLGTGIGCGIIIDGNIYRGNLSCEGEIGRIIVKYNGRKCSCGRKGCLEAYATGPSLARDARKRIKNHEEVAADKEIGLTAKDVYLLAEKGDSIALKLIEKQVEYIGIAFVNVLNLLSPEKIIISGGMCKEDKLLIEPLKAFVKANGYSMSAENVKIEKAELGEDAPMIGAAMLYKDIGNKTYRLNSECGEVL